MRLSLNVTCFPDGADAAFLGGYLSDLASAAEATGIDTIWLADHLLQVQPGRDENEPVLEALTTLGFLAARTSRCRLGTMVSPATVRAPAILVKAMTTLDVLSGGRAWVGLGAGYSVIEAEAMGLDLPGAVTERFDRLTEVVRIACAMRSGEEGAVEGNHYRLTAPINRPRPVGRLPILIGGAGERRTLRLVARYADACNVFDGSDGGATVRRKLAVLDRHCADVGRDPTEIDRTVSTFWPADESVRDLVRRCSQLRDAGATHVVVLRARPWRRADVASLDGVVAGLDG